MGDNTAGPHLSNQLVVGNYPLVILRQIAQHVHDLGLQAHAFVSGAHLIARGIYLHLAQSKRGPVGFVVFVRHGSILSFLCGPLCVVRSLWPFLLLSALYRQFVLSVPFILSLCPSRLSLSLSARLARQMGYFSGGLTKRLPYTVCR